MAGQMKFNKNEPFFLELQSLGRGSILCPAEGHRSITQNEDVTFPHVLVGNEGHWIVIDLENRRIHNYKTSKEIVDSGYYTKLIRFILNHADLFLKYWRNQITKDNFVSLIGQVVKLCG